MRSALLDRFDWKICGGIRGLRPIAELAVHEVEHLGSLRAQQGLAGVTFE